MARSFQQGDEPVAGYKLTRFLGRGGFGEVWQAEAPGGTEVAFKIIDLGEKSGLKEFRAIQRVKRVRHPNLVPIIALWLRDENGRLVEEVSSEQQLSDSNYKPAELFIAMGLGDKSLHDRFKEAKEQGLQGIPGLELISYIEDAARAIDHLNSPKHDLGQGPVAIQHCDIKPQNILIVGDAAQVCDFGLARVLGENRSTTNPAVTLAFAAPEILEDSNPSSTTDQYALAMTYYYLRTGSLPFTKVDPSTIIMEALDSKLDFSRVSAAEQLVIKRATGRKPAGRFGTCLDMARELRRALEATGGAGKAASLVIEPGSEIVAGHKLVRCLGRGAYGEVWEAMAPGRIPVALKVIRDLDRAGGRGKQEFKALEVIQRVTHNHLMELRAYWLLDRQGQPIPDELRGSSASPTPVTLIIATKLADKNLAQVLEEYQARGMPGIPIQELLRYTRQAAEAIDYLNAPRHKLGDRRVSIQHRDVKPDNIMLADGIVRLTDFGLAKVVELDEVSAEIHQDSVGFTFHYAAPEVMRGRVTKWSDQYSLAITYYFLRSGQLPFERVGSAYDMMMRQLEGKLDLSLLPEQERRVLAKAVQVVPEDRYPTCMAFIQAIEATLPASGDVPPLPHKPQPRGQSAWEMALLTPSAGGGLDSTQRRPEPLGLPGELEPLKSYGSSGPPPVPPSPVPLAPAAMAGAAAAGAAPSGMSLYGSITPLPDAPRAEMDLAPMPSELEMLSEIGAPHAMPTSRPYADKAAASPEPPPLPAEDMFNSIGAANLPSGMADLGRKPASGRPSLAPGQRPPTMHADNLLDLYPELQSVFSNKGTNAPPGSVSEYPPREESRPESSPKESQQPSRVDWKRGGTRTEAGKPKYLLFVGAVFAGLVLVLVVGLLIGKGNRGKTDTSTALASNGGEKQPSSTVGGPAIPPPDTSPRQPSATAVSPPIPTVTHVEDTKPTPPPEDNKAAELRRLALQLSTKQAIEDESTFQQSARQLLDYDQRLLSPEMLAYRAEYLLEKLDQTQPAQECLTLAKRKDPSAPTPGIVHYVEARTQHKLGRKEDAAVALSQAPNDLLVGFRQAKAQEVYAEAAKDRARNLKIDPAKLEPAGFTAPSWIGQASALCSSMKEDKLPTDLALLFAWASPTPKAAHLDLLLEKRVAEVDRRRDGPVLAASLHRRRAKLREASDSAGAINDYKLAYDRARGASLPPLVLYETTLAPGLAFAETVGEPRQLDEGMRTQVAALYAAKGELIDKNPEAKWDLKQDDPNRDASTAYEKAVEYYPLADRTKAKYLVQQGRCLAKLGEQLTRGEVLTISRAADTAIRLDGSSPIAFNLKGTATHFRAKFEQASVSSRSEEQTRKEVLELLDQADRAFTQAIAQGRNANDPELPTFYTNRSLCHTFRGVLNYISKQTTKAREDYGQALKDASEAIKLGPDNPSAYGALGSANLLLAISVESGSPDAQAYWTDGEKAFRKQIELRPTNALGHLNLGQLFMRRAQREKDRSGEYLAQAKKSLEEALALDAKYHDSNYWVGVLALEEGQWDRAAQFFYEALQDPRYLLYNAGRIAGNLTDDNVEKILFSGRVNLSGNKLELAPWFIMRCRYRIGKEFTQLKKSEQEPLPASSLKSLEECMGEADRAAKLAANPVVRGMAQDSAVNSRLLAVKVKDVAAADRRRFLEEAKDRLRPVRKEHLAALGENWVSLARAFEELARNSENSFDLAQRTKLYDEAIEAARAAREIADDEATKKRLSDMITDFGTRKRALQ